MEPMITPQLVALDEDLGDDPEGVVRALAERLHAAGRLHDVDGYVADVMAREASSSTGQKGGIAIPHCRSAHVATGSLAFARLSGGGADFNAADDSRADLVFLLAAPEGGGSDHMKLLSKLARGLVREEFTTSLRDATTDEDVVRIVRDQVEPQATVAADAPASAGAASAASASSAGAQTSTESGGAARGDRLLVAITACPTGIAHTYMAADSLEQAAERAGVRILVETQGSSGSAAIDQSQIDEAVAVIFAADVGVNGRDRFEGKPVVRSGVKRAIDEADEMVAEALAAADDPDARLVQAGAGGGGQGDDRPGSAGDGEVSRGEEVRQWLMTGVSYMIPFVAAGGLLIALGFLIAGYQITDVPAADIASASLVDPTEGGLLQYLGGVVFQLGALGFGFLVPALAGYIAYAIADRPGIAPGFIVGSVAVAVSAGFIGGLIGGMLAGIVARSIGRLPVPSWARGLMPVVVIPLGATLVAGGVMFLFLGQPLAAVTTGLENWLSGLSGGSALVLGAVLGAMMAFDMGGPVNKAAYTFAAAGLAGAAQAAAGDPALVIMAAVMGAGMVPPLALALATTVRPTQFTPAERENGKAAWLLGASFITEGAIPFAAADPIRVIPPIMLGAAVTGAIITTSGVGLRAPHGGIFVAFAIDGVVTFLLALVAGTLVGGAAVVAAKRFGSDERHEAAAA